MSAIFIAKRFQSIILFAYFSFFLMTISLRAGILKGHNIFKYLLLLYNVPHSIISSNIHYLSVKIPLSKIRLRRSLL